MIEKEIELEKILKIENIGRCWIQETHLEKDFAE